MDRSGAVIDSQAVPGYWVCIDHNGVRPEVVKFPGALSAKRTKFGAVRMGCVERAARDQLGGVPLPGES